MVVKGDVVDEVKDRPLIIVNHRCRLDWMFYWMVAQRNGRLYNEKIIMKHELKLVPGPGHFFYGFTCSRCVFLMKICTSPKTRQIAIMIFWKIQ